MSEFSPTYLISHEQYSKRNNEKRRVPQKSEPWNFNVNGLLLHGNNDILQHRRYGSFDGYNTHYTNNADNSNHRCSFTGNATTSAGAINFTIDLTNATYSKLKTAGSYLIIGDLIVAFSTTSVYAALSKVCTHEGTTVQYRSSENDIYCNNHGSEFNLTGTVDKGPAVAALKAYKAVLSTDGNTLTVTA